MSSRTVVSVLNDLIHSDDLASGTLHIARKSVNLWQVVDSAVLQLRGQASQSGVSLSLDMELDHEDLSQNYSMELEQLRVVGDDGKLEQVVCMLVGSAVKSAGSSRVSGEWPWVRVSGVRNSTMLK
jgi:hypothetical protein